MIILVYDIQDDKLRTKFSKFLERYGKRIQYSVFEIKNSQRILDIVKTEIKMIFEKKFSQTDSVIIFDIRKIKEIIKFGNAKNDEADLLSV